MTEEKALQEVKDYYDFILDNANTEELKDYGIICSGGFYHLTYTYWFKRISCSISAKLFTTCLEKEWVITVLYGSEFATFRIPKDWRTKIFTKQRPRYYNVEFSYEGKR